MIELTNADQIEIDRLCHTGRTLTIRELNDLYRAGLAAGIERAAKRMEPESTNTAITIRALVTAERDTPATP